MAADIKIAGSFPAMIHRGRMNIFAALTIGEQSREQVVLREVLVEERAALKAQEEALGSPVTADTKRIVQKQYEALRRVVDEVELLRGTDGSQVVVRLYDADAGAARAARALKQSQFDAGSIERVPVGKTTELYSTEQRSRLFETILSGAAGGAMWGSVSGALAGFGVLHLSGLGLERAPLLMQEQVWGEVALGTIAAGSFVGAMLGTFIGWGVQGGDAYLYDQSLERGKVLLKLHAEPRRAAQASEIIAQINWESQGQGKHALA